MNFIDLEMQQKLIKNDLDAAIEKVLLHGKYIQGPEVFELESELQKYTDAKYCITVANGTDALLISQLALGIGADDEVIMPSFNYISAAETAGVLGAKQVFVDVCKETFNIDTNLIENAITEKTKLIIATSLFGQCADFDKINLIAEKYQIPVIEDAAQSFGATYKTKKSCNLTTIATTSFFPAKPLGCYGDGGAIFTNNDDLAAKIRKISRHGQTEKYKHGLVGVNSRLDTLQAAILLEKLKVFDNEVALKNKVAERYNLAFKAAGLDMYPKISGDNNSVFAQYTVISEQRENILKALSAKNIPFAIYYPMPVHKQEAYLDKSLILSSSEYLSKYAFSLPMNPYLADQDIKDIVDTIYLATQ